MAKYGSETIRSPKLQLLHGLNDKRSLVKVYLVLKNDAWCNAFTAQTGT